MYCLAKKKREDYSAYLKQNYTKAQSLRIQITETSFCQKELLHYSETSELKA